MINHAQLEAYRQTLPESQRYEIHRFFVVHWDIVKARFITQQPGRRRDTLNVRQAARAYGFDKPQTMDNWAHVDPKLAMSDEIDLDTPVILALIAREEVDTPPIPLLIDGRHRLYKAYREERVTLPCYALSPEEEQSCRV